MLNLTNVSKTYPKSSAKAVDSLNLDVKDGEIFGFLGPNGAGKTTLMRLILDLIKADEGRVTSNGQPVSETEEWKNYTGSFIDGRFLIDYLTPEEYFSFIADVYHISKETLEQRLQTFEGLMHGEILGTRKYLRDFSKGYKQRVGIAQAIIGNPEIVILDEPTVGLDPRQIIEIRELIKELGRDSTVILSSHNLSFVADISTRILLLEKGRIVKDLPNADGAAKAELNEYFGMENEEKPAEVR